MSEKMCNRNLSKQIECLPIKSLEELKHWKECDSEKHSSYPLQKRESVKDCPKTLVCHDMKGGYLEDRFHDGSETEDNYYFIHWAMVDIFVYFSHNFITIPPCSWIIAAHRNGVKVLGTIITEWDEGKEICNNLLYDEESVQQISQQLADIASFYKFDGWLINIENKLTSKQVPLLEKFVKILTSKMHKLQEDSLVIWYDSVIQTGDLKWQNELNENNRNFFQACDGIFLNYNWTHEHLKKSVDEAGPRKTDVFVGVDVFGRGCLGGGGFSTNIAVTAARDFNLSVAIFAPGWVHECLDVQDFKENQYKYWNSLTELCCTRAVESLPYYTSFCPGFGKKMFEDGKIMSDKPWYNIGLQQPQPSFHYTNCSSQESMVSLYTEDAFNGGGCLQLKVTNFKSDTPAVLKILSTNFLINTDCSVSYTFKSSEEKEVGLVFSVCKDSETYLMNFLGELQDGEASQMQCSKRLKSSAKNIRPSSVRATMGSVKDGLWVKREYMLCCCHPNENYFIKEISVQIHPNKALDSGVSVLIGEISISPS